MDCRKFDDVKQFKHKELMPSPKPHTGLPTNKQTMAGLKG